MQTVNGDTRMTISTINCYALKYKGERLVNPLAKVLEVAKEKGIKYDSDLNLMPADYYLSELMEVVQACGLNYNSYVDKYYDWQEMLANIRTS